MKKKFKYALAAAVMLLAVGCDTNEPNKPSDEDANVTYKEDIVLTSVEYTEDHDGMGNVMATGDNEDYSVTLCIKGANFVDGTYSAKCETGESEVWGFLFNTKDYSINYTIDSISATVKKYADEGRIEITAKYYTATHDSLYTIHFGQQITPVANKTIDITDADFYDFTKESDFFAITNMNSELKKGDFVFMFSLYADQLAGSYTAADLVGMMTEFGYVADIEEGTLEKELSVLYGTFEVKEAGADAYTAVAKFMGSDSIFYTINISGSLAETGYAVDATEDTEYAFDAAKTTAQYSYQTQDGLNYAAFVLMDDTKYLQFIAFYEGKTDSITIVPATAYYIGTDYTAGTIAAGFYDAENQQLGNSYFGTISGQYLTDPIYCFTDGSINITNQEGKCSIEVYAYNSKGASAHVTYTGTLTAAKSSSSAPALAPSKNYAKSTVAPALSFGKAKTQAEQSHKVSAYPNLFLQH